MKKILRKTLVVAFMLGTLMCYSKDNNDASKEAKKVRVEFKAVKKGQTISIKDKNDAIIYDDIIQISGNYSKTFDLSALKNGRYTAELYKDFKIIVKPFFVENNLVTFLTKNETIIFKPLIRTENNLVLISKLNFDEQPIKIKLYYEDELIYSETSEEKGILNRTYRLLKNLTGAYKAVVYSNNRTFIKEFKI